MSIKEKILAGATAPTRKMTPPGWPVEVEVRGMTVRQRLAFRDYVEGLKGPDGEVQVIDPKDHYPKMVLPFVFDPETGGHVFDDADADALLDLAPEGLEAIAKTVLELSGLDPDAEKRARGESKEASGDGST
jgi:hypothetical protein